MAAYYNEFDPYAAQWLRNLIARGLIAPGEVDERSILNVTAEDLIGFTQCHFFAGIGGWSLAARLAGWSDDRPLWTGSCPCQPFSVAGKGGAQEDERHLWPELFRLVAARIPPVLMGEQVAAAVGKDWLDGVCVDLEGIGYTSGAVVVPACAVDAPHRRDRLWFVADTSGERRPEGGNDHARDDRAKPSSSGERAMADADGRRYGAGDPRPNQRTVSGRDGEGNAGLSRDAEGERWKAHGGEPDAYDPTAIFGGRSEPSGERVSYLPGPLVNADDERRQERRQERRRAEPIREEQSSPQRAGSGTQPGRNGTNWSGAEWLLGADGKARRFEPGIRLLAHGVPARVGKLRAFGNAIVPQVAAEVIGAYMDATP